MSQTNKKKTASAGSNADSEISAQTAGDVSRKGLASCGMTDRSFVVSRLVALSFFFAFCSVLQHVEAFFGCQGLLTSDALNFGLFKTPLGLAKDRLALLCAIACGLNFLVALFGEGVFGTLRTRFVTLFSVVVYAGVQLQDENKQLFHKDYDLLLLEVGLLVSLFGLSAGYFQHATSKALTFCLFRFTFTFAVSALYGTPDERPPCGTLWTSEWLTHSYELPEPSSLSWYFRYGEVPAANRALTFLVVFSFTIAASLLLLLPQHHDNAALSDRSGVLDFMLHGARETALLIVCFGLFFQFVVLQASAWLPILFLALVHAASTGKYAWLSIPKDLLRNWGSGGGVQTVAGAPPEEAARASEKALLEQGHYKYLSTSLLAIPMGVLFGGVAVPLVGYATETGEGVFQEFSEERAEWLMDTVLLQLFLASCAVFSLKILLDVCGVTLGGPRGLFSSSSSGKGHRGGKGAAVAAATSSTSSQQPASPSAVVGSAASTKPPLVPSAKARALNLLLLGYVALGAASFLRQAYPGVFETGIAEVAPTYGREFFCPNFVYKPLLPLPSPRAKGWGATSPQGTASRRRQQGAPAASTVPGGVSAVRGHTTPRVFSLPEAAAQSLSKEYTGGSKRGNRVDQGSTTRRSLLEPIPYRKMLGFRIGAIKKWLPLRYRIQEDEDRPPVGVVATANRVETTLHHLTSKLLSSSMLEQLGTTRAEQYGLPRYGPVIRALPEWLRRFMRMITLRQKESWSMLRGEFKDLIEERAELIELKSRPSGDDDSVGDDDTDDDSAPGTAPGTKKPAVPITGNVLKTQLIYNFRDIEYDLRSNRWWDVINQKATGFEVEVNDLAEAVREECAPRWWGPELDISWWRGAPKEKDEEEPNEEENTAGKKNKEKPGPPIVLFPWKDASPGIFVLMMLKMFYVSSGGGPSPRPRLRRDRRGPNSSEANQKPEPPSAPPTPAKVRQRGRGRG
eukprot:g3935.t1